MVDRARGPVARWPHVQIELFGLTKRFARTLALKDLTLQIPSGSVVAVIGLNGAGKTTLLRCLSGILSPTSGEIRYDGAVFRRARIDLRKRLLFLPDFPPGYAGMDVLEHIAMLLRAYDREPSREDETRIVDLLGEFDLLGLARQPIGSLSRGQLYKGAFTGLAAVQPELWLLDEPFASGMDPQGLAVLKHQVRAATAAGATVLYTTQIIEIAERFCDLLLVLDHGSLRRIYSAAELRTMPAQGPESLESRLREFRTRET